MIVEIKSTLYKDIEKGDCFRDKLDTCDTNLYIKTEIPNKAVSLKYGTMTKFADYDEILPYRNVKVLVE